MPSAPRTTAAGPALGRSPERHHLEHRTRRMEFVIRALRDRAAGYERRGDVPEPLRQAIAGFSTELDRDRRRLRDLGRAS